MRNNPIYCKGVNAGEPLKVITDCNASNPRTHHRVTAKIISSATEPILIHNLTQSFNINSTTSAFTDPDLPSIYCVFDHFDSEYYFNLFRHSLSKDCDKTIGTKPRRQRNVMGHSFEMISFNLETSTVESDEQIIFDVTSL